MRLLVLAASLLFVGLYAGCSAPATVEAPQPGPAAAPAVHPLAGSVEPDALEAPVFSLLGSLAAGGPAYGAGEPSVATAPDGSLYVAFPGCDRGFYLVDVPTQEGCGHGLVYRSTDDGTTWTRLNRDGDGRYDDESPSANGDAEVAVDAAGTVWVSNLGGGIQVHSFDAEQGNWTYIGNVVEEGEFADRQWMAAAAPGHVIVAWMGSGVDAEGVGQGRAVIVNTTFDGGSTWSGSLALGRDIGWLGPVAFGPDGLSAYLPFTQVENAAVGSEEFSMQVARTRDGGATWDVIDTGVRIEPTASGTHWSGVLMAPALDVTGDGTVVLAWAQDSWLEATSPLPAQPTSVGTSLLATLSHDNGTTWTQALYIDVRMAPGIVAGSPIMPWVAGGAGDRFAVTYLRGNTLLDTDYAGTTWDVMATVLDGFGTEGEARVDTLIEANIHQGGICARGGMCLITASDRALLDFFESDLTPDGRLFVAYPADPLTGGKMIEIRAALQDGGTPLATYPSI